MTQTTKKFPKHACQYCGAERKYVETLVNDEQLWNEDEKRYEPNRFMKEFDYTGKAWCAGCKEEWSGV